MQEVAEVHEMHPVGHKSHVVPVVCTFTNFPASHVVQPVAAVQRVHPVMQLEHEVVEVLQNLPVPQTQEVDVDPQAEHPLVEVKA